MQSQLLQKEVFLVEKIDSMPKQSMAHLKAVYFIRPTSENIRHLRQQLQSPRFGEYHLFFSNILKTTQIQVLADSDEQEVVQQVQTGNWSCPVHRFNRFNLPKPAVKLEKLGTSGLPGSMLAVADPQGLQIFCDRVVDGIASVFLALKRRPIIRYQRTSDIAKRIAQEAAKLMYEQESGLFDFRRTEISPLLLVIDRRDDPVTPLLNQWTYQAMVHELIGIEDNKVDLRHIGKVHKDQQEVVLSSEQDSFFRDNMYMNFGDLGMNIKRMVDEFQQLSKNTQNIQTIEDMAKFVDNYPEYRKMQGNVSKHVTMVTEMSKIVEERKLMLVSQTEQELACNASQASAFMAVVNLLDDESISDIDQLRLVMLYALRYEKENPFAVGREISFSVFQLLATQKPELGQDFLASHESRINLYLFEYCTSVLMHSNTVDLVVAMELQLAQFLLKQAGADKRTGDLYGNRDILNFARNMARGLKGVENVYTQHQPLLFQTMESITKGRLRDVDYPFVGNHFQQGRFLRDLEEAQKIFRSSSVLQLLGDATPAFFTSKDMRVEPMEYYGVGIIVIYALANGAVSLTKKDHHP
ncbi:vacuolar protein sorting-associated protein 45 [Asimina triloba]